MICKILVLFSGLISFPLLADSNAETDPAKVLASYMSSSGSLEKEQLLHSGQIPLEDFQFKVNHPAIDALLNDQADGRSWVVSMPVADHRKDFEMADALWLTVPDREESTITQLVAYDSDGKEHLLDAATAPSRPVITIAIDESKMLKQAHSVIVEKILSKSLPEPSHKIGLLSFQDVKEPWFKGDAEIYVVVNYLNDQRQGATQIVPLLGVHEAEREYLVNKLIHYWNDNGYQIIDLVFFEHDSGKNYADLYKLLIAAARDITIMADPSTAAVANALAEISTAIIDALPQGIFIDEDDFLDIVNTAERLTVGTSERQEGVSGNALVGLSTYQIEPAP